MRKYSITGCFFCFILLFTSCAAHEESVSHLHAQLTETSGNRMETDTIENEETSVKITLAVPIEPNEDESYIESGGGVGGPSICVHNFINGQFVEMDSYHSIPSQFMSYVKTLYGEDAYSNWSEKCRSEKHLYTDTECPFEYFNIVRFVNDFQIPRQVFDEIYEKELYNWYDYNVDVIYSGDEEKIQEYYRSDHSDEYRLKRFISIFKSGLSEYVRQNHAEERQTWIARKADAETSAAKNDSAYRVPFTGSINQYSFEELVREFDIPREVAEKELATAQFAYTVGYTIDLDRLYAAERDTSAETAISATTSPSPVKIDESYLIPMNSAAQ